MKNYYIGIAGNIGVGKTTFTKMICEKYNWDPHFEVVIDNPYLEDFYKEMKKWSFHLQIFFLSKRFQVQKKISSLTQTIVQDRTIYEDARIFARSIYEIGNMSKRDWDNYNDLFNEMTSYLKKPDLIVYLKASTDTLIDHIKSRGRDYEKNIDLEYLHLLNIHYDRWISKLEKTGEINTFTVNMNKDDIIDNKDFRETLFQNVYNKLNK
ncbi:MAG: deoxynucleoside kinase [Candidatus Marinimicrobia bacterium]|jgi:deoxyadenosine/deoxycytidine kinase|nr:deoxynucleoside kinase [Candidatus Neomarinimicrobiota bacterium]